jgi:hypothetical protein
VYIAIPPFFCTDTIGSILLTFFFGFFATNPIVSDTTTAFSVTDFFVAIVGNAYAAICSSVRHWMFALVWIVWVSETQKSLDLDSGWQVSFSDSASSPPRRAFLPPVHWNLGLCGDFWVIHETQYVDGCHPYPCILQNLYRYLRLPT